MLTLIKSDLDRHVFIGSRLDPSFIQKLFALIFSYGFFASSVYRFGQYAETELKRTRFIFFYFLAIIIYYCLNFLVKTMLDINIHKNAKIGKSFYIGHFSGIFIGKSVIGNNCSVHQHVRIGETDSANSFPVIGDNVWIGAHSTISNSVVIENNSAILVGSTVRTNIKSKTLVMGNPARIIKHNYDNASLLNLPGYVSGT